MGTVLPNPRPILEARFEINERFQQNEIFPLHKILRRVGTVSCHEGRSVKSTCTIRKVQGSDSEYCSSFLARSCFKPHWPFVQPRELMPLLVSSYLLNACKRKLFLARQFLVQYIGFTHHGFPGGVDAPCSQAGRGRCSNLWIVPLVLISTEENPLRDKWQLC